MVTALPVGYDATRRSLHAVAEHVLAAALHAATGRIGLRATPGGFGTPLFEVEGRPRQIRVEGVDLVVVDGASERRAALSTVAAAATMAGVVPGGPGAVYTLVTPLEPDAPLVLELEAAAVVHAWFALTDAALADFSARHAPDGPPVAQLWPEHFDLAMTLAEVNYGGSPGDDDHVGPYLYVGPWSFDKGADDLWNEPFGASRSQDEIGSASDAIELFERGRQVTS